MRDISKILTNFKKAIETMELAEITIFYAELRSILHQLNRQVINTYTKQMTKEDFFLQSDYYTELGKSLINTLEQCKASIPTDKQSVHSGIITYNVNEITSLTTEFMANFLQKQLEVMKRIHLSASETTKNSHQ
ncbi:hypothetical protein [Piscirickettsia litoralis]|uniref:Uncharacterized protein n=1 Tax=Piscirickettsia litoralis TaxID=1891921 RepID=A0ABX3A2Q5_9GAMM|nr:hypothetical protein [Piscirickettsia litoralis]ODN41918.1 hypothetical protein BGC07_01750 [Piscirickettsia litoralis]